MSLTKKYSFHDTFVKTCEFKNGQGDCKKTRESKKCIDNNCEIVRIPMKKKEILNSYYQNYSKDKDNENHNYIQQGSGSDNGNHPYIQQGSCSDIDTFKCPTCGLIVPTKDILKHIKLHTNIDSSKLFQQTFVNVKPINKSFNELSPQYGGCDTCIPMVGGKGIMTGAGIHENKYICPICHEHHIISDMKDHYFKIHQ